MTGGAGYVGSVSVEALTEAGHEVVVLDDLSTGHRAAVADGARLVPGSYGDRGAVTAVLRDERIDAILHCAARSLVAESLRDPGRYYRDNVAGGITLLEAARATGTSRIVFSSTAGVYGAPESAHVTEDAPLRPINPYGETKRTFEAALGWYAAAYGLRAVSLRYFNVAGATQRNGEVHDPETHLIPNVLAATEGGDPVTVFGEDYPTPDGTCIRDYIHVEDLIDAHVGMLKALKPGDARAYNLGIGRGHSVREVIDGVRRVTGREFKVVEGARRAGDPPRLFADPSRIRADLGWSAAITSLDEIIRTAWEWFSRHPDGY